MSATQDMRAFADKLGKYIYDKFVAPKLANTVTYYKATVTAAGRLTTTCRLIWRCTSGNVQRKGGTSMRTFWKCALIRALRTLAQTAIATIGTTAVLEEVNWLLVGSSAVLAGILSILNSVATGLPEVDE